MPGPYLSQGAFKTRITANDTTQQEELGIWRFEAGKILKYVKAGALIPAGEAVVLDSTVAGGSPLLMGQQVLQVSAITNMIAGIAETTLASLNFGWITTYGPATARVVTNANPGVILGSSATTGVLSTWGVSNLHGMAVALQTGLSAGSAVFVTLL